MDEHRRLEWSDFDTSTIETATRAVVRLARVRRERAEEIVQEALVAVMRVPRFVRCPRSFLIGAALRVHKRDIVRDFHRLDRLSVPDDQLVGHAAPPSADPSVELVDEESGKRLHSAVHSALRNLSAVDRRHLKSFYFANRSPSELDDERGESKGTAKVRLHRARARLRQLLERTERAEELCK